MIRCQCNDAVLLWGRVADDYVATHLVRDDVVEATADVVYRCPETGRKWIGEFVPDETDVKAFRLRRIMRAAELVELLAAQADPAAGLQWTDPAVEFRPPGSQDTYHGIDEARRWARLAAIDPDFPRTSAISVIDVADDEVVVLGNVAFKRDGHYSENRPAAWLVTVRQGRIVRSLWFDSWKGARTAAGLPETGGPAKRIASRWMFPVAGPLVPRHSAR
jgi:ketosteroid isomerase-like protein